LIINLLLFIVEIVIIILYNCDGIIYLQKSRNIVNEINISDILKSKSRSFGLTIITKNKKQKIKDIMNMKDLIEIISAGNKLIKISSH
jgi:hypothetical protein